MTEQCKLLRELSQDTWKRIQFSRSRYGLKIYEVTITQNLIYEINRNTSNSMVSIFEATNEKTNGNDIELFIQTENGYLFFPVQSKIVYKGQDYPKMEHGNQIIDLINYASTKGGMPLYLLYNYSPEFLFNSDINGISCSSLDFGCSLIDADYLMSNFAFKRTDKNGNKKWEIPSFFDLHPNRAIPWFIPFCLGNNELDKTKIFKELFPNPSEEQLSDLKVYSTSEIEENKDWIPIDTKKTEYKKEDVFVPIVSTVEITEGITRKIAEKDDHRDTKFLPKFRLVFKNED